MTVPSRKNATSMPREGLTRELSSVPSAVRIAFLKESIIAITCGSPQMVAGFGGATVVPGRGVTPGVCPGVGGVPINRVDVGRARNVGVAGAWVAGEAHAVMMAASRLTPNRKAGSVLMFIFVSSPGYYIPREKEKRQGVLLALQCNLIRLAFPKSNDDDMLIQELGRSRVFSVHDLPQCIAARQGHVLSKDILHGIDLRPGMRFQ